jgi:conjugal transfer/type IV secretion protein DotA/TraY
MATTSDPTQPPTGTQTLAGATNDQANGVSLITKLVGDMHLSNTVLQEITSDLLPTAEYWTDPFGGLMALGQLLIITSLIAMGTAAFLASAPLAYGSAVLSFFTGNWGAAATTVAGHAVMNFLATPIFVGLLALMTPGIIIAYVLPMIPWIMWMAGVCGWLILVCEAMIAVPLWMLAHMTFGGDGLHGRAIEGWGLLFNVVFRPVLMVIGLFLGYFIFDAMSWLIRETFGVATAFTLDNGWLVTNFIGIGVLLWIFVMTHVIAALMSFRLVALLPHHLPRLLGFTAANRVDMDDFQQQAAYVPGGQVAGGTARALEAAGNQFTKSVGQGNGEGAAKALTGPTGQSTDVAMDSTLRATSGSQAVEGNVDDI